MILGIDEATLLLYVALFAGILLAVIAVASKGVMREFKLMMGKTKLIKCEFVSDSMNKKVRYLVPDEKGFVHPNFGGEYFINKSFFFMDQDDGIPCQYYKEGHPTPIDPIKLEASIMRPEEIEALAFNVENHVQRKKKKKDDNGTVLMIIGVATLIAVVIAGYLIYTQGQDTIEVLKTLGSTAKYVTLG